MKVHCATFEFGFMSGFGFGISDTPRTEMVRRRRRWGDQLLSVHRRIYVRTAGCRRPTVPFPATARVPRMLGGAVHPTVVRMLVRTNSPLSFNPPVRMQQIIKISTYATAPTDQTIAGTRSEMCTVCNLSLRMN